MAPKASCAVLWSGVEPENPRAGVLNCGAEGAAHEPNEPGARYVEYAPAAPYPQCELEVLSPNCGMSVHK